jgi:hypothetical protein
VLTTVVETEREATTSASVSEIRAEYQRRRDVAVAAISRQDRLHSTLADIRLALFVLAAVLGGLSYFGWLSPFWLILPATAFVASVVAQERAARRKRRSERAAAYYERGLARLDDQWMGKGEPGTRFLALDHPYAGDLDLFGTGSLFERLCTARTESGQSTLAAWLLAPALIDEIQARQMAIAELAPLLDLREDLALLGGDVRGGVDANALVSWATGPPVVASKFLSRIAIGLALYGFASLLGWAAIGIGPIPFAVAVVADLVFYAIVARRVRAALAGLDRRAGDLSILGEMLGRIEQEPFLSERLRTVRKRLETGGLPPSHRVAELASLALRLEAKQNALIAPLLALVLWSTRVAFAVEAWRAQSGRAVADWLTAVGEIEALASLATYTAENPDQPFPEVVPGEPRFEAESLGHPLIPQAACVRNDVTLGAEPRVLVVSGSNMSGKSTLLRTVGVNTVLALAGGPVRASRLRLCRFAVGATLRIQDSLQAGRSRFYAEILRVRQLVDLAANNDPPLLFLLDEIFAGTNSRDRALGAEGVLRGLLERGAMGLVSTHDLALAEIADRLAPIATNVHFEDQLHDGELCFDYRMRPGVVHTSNALALMRAVGLQV